MNKFVDLLKRFHRDERGAFLALFGVLAVVLIATAGATVDFTSVQNARTRAQVALDAAALALQPDVFKGNMTTDQAKTAAQDLVLNRLGTDASATRGAKPVYAQVVKAETNVPENTTLTLTANLTVPLYFVSLVGIKEMSMTIVSQTTRGATDLEVAIALDVTGSMKGSKISALRTAAAQAVEILVQDQQDPTYSKVALIPYSMGVNVGTYADSVRGTPTGPKVVTGAVWQVGTNKTINNSGITKANPAQITTSAAHGLSNGDTVWLSGISNGTYNGNSTSGWTALNDRKYVVTVINSTTFTLNSTNTNISSYTTRNSGAVTNAGGTVRKCFNVDCEVTITSAGHGLVNGDRMFFQNIGGMTQLNSTSTQVTNENPTYFMADSVSAGTFQLDGTTPNNYTFGTYTSGGTLQCVQYGCQYYRFTAASSSSTINLHRVSTCVSERTTSPYQYTDTAPATAPVGPNYAADDNPCLTNQIVPLTSDKSILTTAIGNLVDGGSTSGQIGTAWAWYMLSPDFASLWPSGRKPADYQQPNLMKVVILMTDGSFNSVYCNGVISADSTTGSGATADHINCNAQNGNPFQQTKNMCDAMKGVGNAPDTGIIVYTIGFDIADQTNEKEMLQYCASDTNKYKLASDSAGLTKAFTDIAQEIAQLRVSE